MSKTLQLVSKLTWLPKPITRFLEKRAKSVPAIKKMIDKEYDKMLTGMEHSLKPYKHTTQSFARLPDEGIPRNLVLEQVRTLAEQEKSRWKEGYVSGGIYHGDEAHIGFLNEVYALQSQSNPLHSDLFPSITKYEAEIISMTANMLGAGKTDDEICGSISSGGTESILLAFKTYRDRAREEFGITAPEMITCTTAHAAFEKAAHYFGIKHIKVGFNANYQMDVEQVRQKINKNTIAIVGSAPAFPHGIIDPIEQLAEIALQQNIGLHVDCCLGGFVLPWAEELGYPVPPFDFRLKGVTSISADTHKYGYAAKGTSVILYRSRQLRSYQYYTTSEWPGGLYFSPTFAGSRPGALSAACWAAMVSIGREGYLQNTKKILETAAAIKAAINAIPELEVLGNPLFVVAFRSRVPGLDIYRVMDEMGKRQWNLNGLHKPACLHIAVTLRHTQPGVAERFARDLQQSVEAVKNTPATSEGNAPVYGMASGIPFRGMVTDLLKQYIDVLYKV
ncbi:aminotransferase class V-fold PLP-dependent enzyme [Sphingobacteriales bacterium UPWRP_1]|nr:aspartate aminotransferase family protein [Sphingobacteriales bacterium TSM_CSM]PSJ72048.1 aminotransferase class V-fold PLP-dependent enzyme [Sphingobacteriales bacterium UPWRP_1]